MLTKKIIVGSFIAMQIVTTNLFAADKVLATVGNYQITQEDADMLLKAQNTNYNNLSGVDKTKVLDQLIERKLLSLAASKTNIVNSALYKETLEKVKLDLALQLYMQDMAKDIKVTDEQTKKYYDANKANMKKPNELKANHILVKSEKEAKDIIATLLKSKSLKKDFEKMAQAKSTDGSAKKGGDLGWFMQDQMVPEFGSAAANLKVGSMTKEPVKSRFGYHVIYLDGKKESKDLSYNEIKEDLKKFLSSEEFKKRVDAVVSKEKSKNKIIKK